MIAEFIILLGLALFAFYKWSTYNFDYFEKRNIPYDKPYPLFGSQKDIVFRKISMFDNVNKLYKQFNTSVFGLFDQRMPVYGIRDPALLKRITVKDFDHFINHRTMFSDVDGGLFGNSLFSMRNDKWKDMRSTLTPVFTGSKMRQMFTLINDVAHESMNFLKNDSKFEKEIDFNIKDYFTRFTNDAIASAVFGLKVNSFKDECNEFYMMGKRVTTFTPLQNLKFFMYTNFKYIMRILKFELFDKKDTGYFLRLVLDAMKYRQQEKIIRPDMVNMMMEAKGIYIDKENQQKPTTNREWTDDEIVAQFFLFFFAGFETTAILMAFAANELMMNPDVQDKLRQEIMEVKENLAGKPLTYEALQGMKYLDMVTSETLRRWPPAVVVDRQCNKDFSYKDENIDVTIKEGQVIWIPIVGYHLDEKYFPDPLKFDPERFSDENKSNIQPFTYLPFGLGPRNCIGNRFALLEAKAILFYILSEFQIKPSPKSTIPVVLESSGFNLAPKNGFWMKLIRLEESMIAGAFDQRQPVFLIRDPALLKQITVKDFSHFINHRLVFNDSDGGLFGNAVSNMRDEKWKSMRSTLSPVFTGSKMRQMFVLINDVAHESMMFLKRDGKAEIDFNIKDYFTRFTNDVIASAVFGIQVNSFTDENNEFYSMGKKVTKFSTWQNLKFLLFANFKYIMRIFKMELFDVKYTSYFSRLVIGAMKYRQEHNIVRPDMINMMMEAQGTYINNGVGGKVTPSREWSDDEIVAQFFIFFFAGFEPTSVLMAFASHELMVNPDVQDKLRQEIIEVKENLGGKPLTYEALQGMKYLDMVISETLRRWPAAAVTDRQCNKDFHYKDDEVDVTIKAGDVIWIPIVGFHMDEKYFPDPLKFDPERFSDENKDSIEPFTYLPFGVGPRSCIANRFALLESKAMIFHLVSEFEIKPSPKSTIPMELQKGVFNQVPKDGFWAKLIPIKC